MAGKSNTIWKWAKDWCLQNPGKTATVVTKDGKFTIMFKPHDK